MMLAKDYRQAAWSKLSGNWGTMIAVMIIQSVIVGAVAGATFFLAGLGAAIVAGPLTLGVSVVSLTIVGKKKASIEQMFDGFKKNFLSSFLLSLLISIFTALWSMLFVIPGIIKSYAYSMSYYVLHDNPNMSANDARKKSMEIMQGNKWRLFCLHFSFIGWLLLCILTFGILTLFVAPYMQVAEAEFYRSLVPEHRGGTGSKHDPFDEGGREDEPRGSKFGDDSDYVPREHRDSDDSDSGSYGDDGSRTADAADAIFRSDDDGGSRTADAADAIFRGDDEPHGRDYGDGNGDGNGDAHNHDYGYEYDSNDDDTFKE